METFEENSCSFYPSDLMKFILKCKVWCDFPGKKKKINLWVTQSSKVWHDYKDWRYKNNVIFLIGRL